MMPSIDVVIRCLRFVDRHIAVVTSPHVVLHTAFPVAVSYIVTVLSAQLAIMISQPGCCGFPKPADVVGPNTTLK